MSDRNFEIFEVRLSLISKDYHLDGLQVFLQILTLSIIGIHDTSLVIKIPKTIIKVFGSVEFVFWVFIVNAMLSTVKTARIPANSSG